MIISCECPHCFNFIMIASSRLPDDDERSIEVHCEHCFNDVDVTFTVDALAHARAPLGGF